MTIPDHECSIAGCDSPIKAKALCNLHYMRSYRHGSPSVVRTNRSYIGRPADLVDDVQWLMDGGMSAERALKQIGITAPPVIRAYQEVGAEVPDSLREIKRKRREYAA